MTEVHIREHYESIWLGKSYCRGDFESPRQYNRLVWHKGPMIAAHPDFCILEFPPTGDRAHWVYATCGMSANGTRPIELHLFSANRDDLLAEILTAAAYYHLHAPHQLDVGHTIYFGRPWKPGSQCTYGLISLPYLDGPALENSRHNGVSLKYYWLIPITEQERHYKMTRGLEALETAFEQTSFNYLDPERAEVV